ncbi:hypothetical protein [Ectobacillus funiculus]|uniref:PH domain-containing protein n=1 Tax=Ectobacillus funiculus TaxID=137993 RepID=A0ABV5WF67_9BACI
MNKISEKRKQLEVIINSLPDCFTTTNENGFTLKVRQGVKWGKTNRKKKWGQAFEESNRFLCAIDFLVNSYDLKELSKRIGLPIRDEKVEKSGIRKISCPEYDTVQISLYNDEYIKKYNFNSTSFTEWVQEVVRNIHR